MNPDNRKNISPSFNSEIPQHSQTEFISSPAERIEQSPATTPEHSPSSNAAPIQKIPTPAPITPTLPSITPPPQKTTPTSSISANNNDKIEKEWVDITKQTIASTRSDPHAREDEIEDIREEYQNRRFKRQEEKAA